MYVYLQFQPSLWTVGFYSPDRKWNPESDHASPEKAAERVHYLNGGDQHAVAGDAEITRDHMLSGDGGIGRTRHTGA